MRRTIFSGRCGSTQVAGPDYFFRRTRSTGAADRFVGSTRAPLMRFLAPSAFNHAALSGVTSIRTIPLRRSRAWTDVVSCRSEPHALAVFRFASTMRSGWRSPFTIDGFCEFPAGSCTAGFSSRRCSATRSDSLRVISPALLRGQRSWVFTLRSFNPACRCTSVSVVRAPRVFSSASASMLFVRGIAAVVMRLPPTFLS